MGNPAVAAMFALVLSGCATSGPDPMALRAELDSAHRTVRELQVRNAVLELEARQERALWEEVTGYPISDWLPATPKGTVRDSDEARGTYTITLGSMDGVGLGDSIAVYRAEEFVAVVTARKVLPQRTIAVVRELNGRAMQKSPIRVGDLVHFFQEDGIGRGGRIIDFARRTPVPTKQAPVPRDPPR